MFLVLQIAKDMERWAKAVNAQKSVQQQQSSVMKPQKEAETALAADIITLQQQQPLVNKMADSGASSLLASTPVSKLIKKLKSVGMTLKKGKEQDGMMLAKVKEQDGIMLSLQM